MTRSAGYFADSGQPTLFRLPLSPDGGLPEPSAVEAVPLGGDWTQVPGLNANGIDATADAAWLVVVNTLGQSWIQSCAVGDPQQRQRLAQRGPATRTPVLSLCVGAVRGLRPGLSAIA